MPECQSITCCDNDDFAQDSSSSGNCPAGWYWDGVECARCAIPAAPALALSAGHIISSFNVGSGLAYRVERSVDCVLWTQLTTATGGAGTESYDDASVTAGVKYCYRIVVEVSAECGYINGEIAKATAI